MSSKLAEKGTETAMAEGEKESTSKAIAAKWTVEIEDAMFKIYNEFLEVKYSFGTESKHSKSLEDSLQFFPLNL